MDSIEHHITEISERLDKFIKEPKDVKGYMLINADILNDIKVENESGVFSVKKSSNPRPFSEYMDVAVVSSRRSTKNAV